MFRYSMGQTHYVPAPITLSDGGVEFGLKSTVLMTQSVTNDAGESSSIDENDPSAAHLRGDFDFYGLYGVTEQLELSAGLRYRYIQSVFQEDFGTGAEEYTLTTSGLESYFIGAKFSFKSVERIKYALEGHYRTMTYKNLVYDGGEPAELAFGNGSREYAVGLSFMYQTLSNNLLEFRGLFRSPGEDISQEIFSDLRYALIWQNTSLYLGIENVLSLENSPYDKQEDAPGIFQGRSQMFNSINRQWFAPYIGLNIALGSKWRLEFKGAMVQAGRSTDLGPRGMITLARRSEKKQDGFAKKDQSFKQYRIEGVVNKVAKSKVVAIVDKGMKDGVKKGMSVDLFYFDFEGGNKLIATGTVLKAKYSKALIKITRRYSRRRVKEGTVARFDGTRN